MRKIIISLGVAAVTGLGALTLAAPASAATPACATAAAGNCGSEVNAYGNALTVTGVIKANAPVVSEPDATTTGRSDFIVNQTTADQDERTFALAPQDVADGLCASQPAGWKRIVLRGCNNSRWQRFTGTDTRDTLGTQWVNVASGDVIQGNGNGNAFIAVPAVTIVPGSYFGWDTAGVVPAS